MIQIRLPAGLLLAAALAACGDRDLATAPGRPAFAEDAGHNATQHVREVNAVTFEFESPCNGEVFLFSGTELLTGTLVDKPENLANGNSVHSHFTSWTDATGTGPTSGATYAIHDIITQNFESPRPPAPQFAASVHESFKVTSSDPALTFRFKVLIHAVLGPGSGFKLTKEVEEATCQG
jgi:hypothetical protein